MRIINPATEEVIRELEDDSVQSLDNKFNLLKAAQPAWSNASLEKRVSLIRKYALLLAENIEHLAFVLSSEVGKPLQQSKNELNGACSRIQWLADHASTYLSDEIMATSPGITEKIRYEPLGVVCNISAWNYPYLVGTNVIVPALIAGNAVIYKPSEYSSLTGIEIQKLLHQAGIPENIFQVAIGAKHVGESILDIHFDGFFFTGSYHTGKHIYERVSSRMVPCQCEMGGKDPLYVTDDIVDIKGIAAGTADGAFYNNGQSCCSVERIYVHEKVYDRYVEEFIKEVKGYKIGKPDVEGVYIGPLTRKEQLNILQLQTDDAIQKGAKLRTGGKRISGKGNYFEPTVLTDVNHSMSVMRDESFGPIIGIMKVSNDEEAIQLMNDTEYGLTAAIYSTDQKRAEGILALVDTGTGYWNCCDRVSAALPWSGRKHSGFGATLSHAGLRAFTKPKALHLKG